MEGENTVRQRKIQFAFLQSLGFDGRARFPNLKFIIRGIIPLPFSSILLELFLPPVTCLLFTSAWIQQDKFEYTLTACSLTRDFAESFPSSVLSFSLLGCHNTLLEMLVKFQIRPRLIIVSFLVDKSFLWVFVFFCVLCAAWLWNLGFFRLPNYVSSLSGEERVTSSFP